METHVIANRKKTLILTPKQARTGRNKVRLFNVAEEALNRNPERRAFYAMLDELLKTHPNQYVAIHQGQIVASGPERLDVAREAIAKCRRKRIYIQLVSREIHTLETDSQKK